MNKKINELLKPDTKIVQDNLKSILYKEVEYSKFLYVIEKNSTNNCLRNKVIKDQIIINYLKHFMKNIDKSINYFESKFEQELYSGIVNVLNEKRITKYELILCIKYILWSIDNRNWLNDSQAYIKWLANSLNIFNITEKKAYAKKVRTLCKRKGMPNKQIEAMLNNNFEDINVVDQENTDIECEFFALNGDKKFDFVIKNLQISPTLIELYYDELMGNKDYDCAEKLCKSILEIMPEYFPMEIFLGVVYQKKGNKILAKYYFESALKMVKTVPDNIFPSGQKARLIKEVNELLKEV